MSLISRWRSYCMALQVVHSCFAVVMVWMEGWRGALRRPCSAKIYRGVCSSFQPLHKMLRSTSRAASEVLLSTRRDPAVAHSYAALSRFFRQQDWRRPLHQVPRHQARLPLTWAIERPTFTLYFARRYSTTPARESSVSGASKARIDPDDRPPGKDGHGAAEASQATSTVVAKEKDSAAMHAHVSSFPRSLRRLALSLPSSGFRRPTKEEWV